MKPKTLDLFQGYKSQPVERSLPMADESWLFPWECASRTGVSEWILLPFFEAGAIGRVFNDMTKNPRRRYVARLGEVRALVERETHRLFETAKAMGKRPWKNYGALEIEKATEASRTPPTPSR